MPSRQRKPTVRWLAVNLNGISVGYLFALFNAILVTVGAFGVNLRPDQRVALGVLFNTALALVVHLSHRIGEATAGGQTREVAQAKMEQAAADEKGG